MLKGANAMQRLNDYIKEKDSRICVVLNLDADIPKAFKERLNTSREVSDEIIYEYFTTYLQEIVDIVPAVKIIKAEKNKLYWNIMEAAKALGFFVIAEVEQEDIGYIMENKTKLIIENSSLDAVVLKIDLYEKLKEAGQFLKLLKKEEKGAFISARKMQNERKKKRIRIFAKPKDDSIRSLFSELQHDVDQDYYDSNGEPTYLMIGVAVLEPEQIQMVSAYNFTLYEEERNIEDIVNIFDGYGLGMLVEVKTPILEEARQELLKKKENINTAINEFYGWGDF